MKIRITHEFTEQDRKAIGYHFGKGSASRKDIIDWIGMCLEATLEDLHWDLEQYLKGKSK
jgi:hypothetical protein